MKLYTYRSSTSHLLLFIFLFICVGAVMRFFQISWGAPYFFHPDERNIAMAVTRLSPDSLNPEFFAYGGLPIYFIYIVGVGVNFLYSFFTEGVDFFSVSFAHAILISRVVSAFLSVGVLLLLLRLRSFFPTFVFWIVFLLSVFSVGYIQYAHFGTFEMWLTFFSFLLFLLLVTYFQTRAWRYFLFASIVFGLLISIKVSSFVVLPVLFVPFLFFRKRSLKKRVMSLLISLFVVGGVSVITFLVTNPFILLDNASYISSLTYESSVARGTLPVFYTGRFYETIPVVFHFLRVFPFLLNPMNTLLLFIGVPVCGYISWRRRDAFLLFTLAFFLLLFIPQAFLFVKWNRYMIPTLPFAYIVVGYTLYFLLEYFSKETRRMLERAFFFVAGGVAVLFSMSFFVTVYFSDTRVDALAWAVEHIRPSAPILTEVYDLGVVPFEDSFSNISLVNSYEFESGEESVDLSRYEYVLIPSPRILRSRVLLPKYFPDGHKFYSSLIHEQSGYRLEYRTPCNIFCKIAYLGDPIYFLEETANVFDRPTVFIYENTQK